MTDTTIDVAVETDSGAFRRELVPSSRERAAGRTVTEPVDVVFTRRAARRKTSPKEAIGALRDFTPRKIAGGVSTYPLVLFALLGFMEAMDGAIFSIIGPDLQDILNVSISALLPMFYASMVAANLAGPIAGYFADRWHRVRCSTLLGTIRWLVGSILVGVFPNFPVFALSRVSQGVFVTAAGSFRTPLTVDLYPPDSMQRVFSFGGVVYAVGGVVGPLIIGAVAVFSGALNAVVVTGVLGCLLTWGTLRIREPVRGKIERESLGGAVSDDEAPPVPLAEGMRALTGIRSMRRMWLAVIFMSVSGYGVLGFIGFYYRQRYDLGAGGRSIMIAISAVGGALGLAVYGTLADRLTKVRPAGIMNFLGAALALEALSLLLIPLCPWPVLTAVIAMVPAFTAFVFNNALNGLIARIAPPRIMGLAQGMWPLFSVIGLISLAVLTPIGFRWFGANGQLFTYVPFSIAAALTLLSIAPVLERDIRAAEANALADEVARASKLAGSTKLLVCRGVEFEYEGTQVLHGVDLDVEEGELIALLGTNGAGKSTLLRAISGLQPATGGAVFLDGEDIRHSPAYRNAGKGVVLINGGKGIFPGLTVKENLTAAQWLHTDDPDIQSRIDDALALFPRLRERMGVRAGDLSGGEQHMLALAQGLIAKPKLLLIDELSLGLAPQVVDELLEVLRGINATGVSIMLVEQSVNVALNLAKRAIFMERGSVRFDGPTESLVGRGDLLRSIFLGQGATSTSDRRTAYQRPTEDVEHVLEVKDVALSYGGLQALSDVSFHLDPEEIVGIVGPNGAGKSSLVDVITGFARPSHGSITLLGTDVTDAAPDVRARLGLVRSYQTARLFPALTVAENIAVAQERHIRGVNGVYAGLWLPNVRAAERKVARRATNLLESLGLEQMAQKFVSELSTGTRRIVDIACMLAAQPRVLVLDEPSSGLAQAEAEQLPPMIRRIVKEAGCALIVIEHDLGVVSNVSDRVIAMQLGTVLKEGTPSEVLEDPLVIEALIGRANAAIAGRSSALATT
jgi:branched-chain amino acid transport system ATP-binding protein